MKTRSAIKAAAAVLALTMLSGMAFAQQGASDYGKDEYDANCAVCHDNAAKGNGPYGAFLRQQPTDLTTLAKRNGGVLPVKRIYETIEGEHVPSHGSRDMPIWGSTYRALSRDWVIGSTPDRQVFIRSRILMLVDYINRLQVN
jgi:mono/diheme cytochrome c family protein